MNTKFDGSQEKVRRKRLVDLRDVDLSGFHCITKFGPKMVGNNITL